MNFYLLAVGISLPLERFSTSKGALAGVQKGRDHGVGHGFMFFVVRVRNAMTEVFIFFLSWSRADDTRFGRSERVGRAPEAAKDHTLH